MVQLPINIISKNGQLNRLHNGEYKQVINAPLLVYGSCYDNKTAVTRDGGLYLLDKNEVIKLDGIRIVKCIPNIVDQSLMSDMNIIHAAEPVRRYVVLTNDNEVYSLTIDDDQYKTQLLESGVNILVGSLIGTHFAVYTDRWKMITYHRGRYNHYQATEGESPQVDGSTHVIGSVITNQSGIFYIDDTSDNMDRAKFTLIPDSSGFLMACDNGLSTIDTAADLVALRDDGSVTSIIEDDVLEDFITDEPLSKIVELTILNYKCYLIGDDGQLYSHQLDDEVGDSHIIKLDVPHNVILGTGIHTKSARMR